MKNSLAISFSCCVANGKGAQECTLSLCLLNANRLAWFEQKSSQAACLAACKQHIWVPYKISDWSKGLFSNYVGRTLNALFPTGLCHKLVKIDHEIHGILKQKDLRKDLNLRFSKWKHYPMKAPWGKMVWYQRNCIFRSF